MEKKCTKCKEVKSLDEFYNTKLGKNGKNARCKYCVKEYRKKYREKNIERFTETSRKYAEKKRKHKRDNMSTLEFIKLFQDNNGLRKCTKCEVLKSSNEFASRKEGKNGKNSICQICSKKLDKKYRETNKEKIKERDKNYRENNREKVKGFLKAYRIKHMDKIKEKGKEYREKNKERIKENGRIHRTKNKGYMNEYIRLRSKKDPLFKLSNNMRCLIRNCLRRQGYTKNTKTFNILKCEYDFFMQYLNGIASNGYQYGIEDLHLDHVIPISLAETEDEAILLSHYSNFQLLSADENLAKSNRYVNPTNLKRVLEHHPNPDKIREIHSRL